jgi:hypothetical protein
MFRITQRSRKENEQFLVNDFKKTLVIPGRTNSRFYQSESFTCQLKRMTGKLSFIDCEMLQWLTIISQRM